MAEPDPDPSLDLQEAEDEGRTMRYWLSRYLRELRIAKGVKRTEIVQWVEGNRGPLDPSTVSNFETNKTWPQGLDALIAAYAITCGIEDGRVLWEAAMEKYRVRGAPPLPSRRPSSAERSVLLALAAAQRKKPYADESQDTPTSIPNRQAGGQ